MADEVLLAPYDPDWPHRFGEERRVLARVFARTDAVIAFRDYLRTHPEDAAAYFRVKADLATRVTKAAYTEAKSPFIEQILAAVLDGQDSVGASFDAEEIT